MKKTIFIFLSLLIPMIINAQTVFYTESFETSDSINLPQGWFNKNNLNIVPLYPFSNWTVRDSGINMPGISNTTGARGQRSYNGHKSVAATWWCMYDTSGSYPNNADAWLITKKFNNIPSDCYFTFYACGGKEDWTDSIQIWVSTTDSTIPSFTHYLGTEIFHGPPFGSFSMYYYDLSSFANQNIRIGFRYVSDYTNGYCVMFDYFQMFGTVGISQLGTNIPSKFALQQNYPNPFNPTTKIKFDLAKATNVKIEIFNSLGQIIKTLVDDYKPAGYYETDFNASQLSSGVYFYRMTTNNFVDMKKMIVVK
jgi:hypothetical protein